MPSGRRTDGVAANDAPTWRARDVALVTLAILAVIAAAKFAGALVVPVVLGILLSYALRPLVARLEKVRVPRALGALLVMSALVAGLGASVWALAGDLSAAVAELPAGARKLRGIVHRWQQAGPGPITHMKEAATELGKTAAEVAGQSPASTPAPASAGPTLESRLGENAAAVFTVFGQIAGAGLLATILLASGDAHRRRLVRIAGPSLARRRITIEILDEIDVQVQRQLLILAGANLLIALLAWPAFAALGLDRAPMWAALVGLLHFIPYAGTPIATIVVGVVALLQFDSVATALGLSGVTATIALTIGFGLVTWLQGRAVSMNAAATFVALLFFGWLWGAWGLLLGGPLLAAFKVVADRIEAMAPIGELLGR
jgi:predicted PurR-regulated permease PerM